MKAESEAVLLRVFLGENDRHAGTPVYECIVQEARRRHMAGATVLRGIMGFGATSRIHTSKILRLSEDLPVVVELVDKPEVIEQFLPYLESVMHGGGLVTKEKARIVAYHPGSSGEK